MSRYISFGAWRFDPDCNRLVNGSTDCKLQPRVARLLEYFLGHTDEVLSHDRLIRDVWQGRIVSDDAVRRAVSSLRRALAVDGSDQCIKTICGKGYRAWFPAPEPGARPPAIGSAPDLVTESREQTPSWHVEIARRGRQFLWTTVLVLSLAIALWAVFIAHDHSRGPDGIASAAAVSNACATFDPNPRCPDASGHVTARSGSAS